MRDLHTIPTKTFWSFGISYSYKKYNLLRSSDLFKFYKLYLSSQVEVGFSLIPWGELILKFNDLSL